MGIITNSMQSILAQVQLQTARTCSVFLSILICTKALCSDKCTELSTHINWIIYTRDLWCGGTWFYYNSVACASACTCLKPYIQRLDLTVMATPLVEVRYIWFLKMQKNLLSGFLPLLRNRINTLEYILKDQYSSSCTATLQILD